MKILLVNDHTGLREAIKELLSSAYSDLAIDEAEDGNQALQLYADRGPYDLVLTDIEHPHLNGIELADAIRNKTPEQQIGIITAYPVRREIFGGVLRMVFDGSALIEFVNQIALGTSEVARHLFLP